MKRIKEASRSAEQPDTGLWQAYRPRMANAMIEACVAIYQETRLSYREAEAARMRVSLINGCLVCRSARYPQGMPLLLEALRVSEPPNVSEERGAPPTDRFYEEIPNWRQSEEFSPRERLAIEYAERVTLTPNEIPYEDELWERLHAHFDDAEIVDLTYCITGWLATGRFVHVLGLDSVCEIGLPGDRIAAE